MTAEQVQRVAEAMNRVGLTATEAAKAMETLAPILKEAWRQVLIAAEHDPVLRFRMWVVEQPRWQQPLMRLAYRIERLVLR